MSVLSFWGQLVDTASSLGRPDASSVRKINYLPQECDLEEDSDAEDLPQEKWAAIDEEAARLESIVGYHAHQKELACARSEAAQVFATKTCENAQQMVEDFCAQTSATRVRPNRKELQELWAQCASLINGTESKMAKAMISTAVVYGISGQLSAENDWQPQLRALTLLEFLYHQPGMLDVAKAERFIAENVIEEASDSLWYLSREVEACREVSTRLLNPEEMAALPLPGRGPTGGSGNAPALRSWQPYDDSGLSPCKANVPIDFAAADEATIEGSCSQLDTSFSDQDDSFVASWADSAVGIEGRDVPQATYDERMAKRASDVEAANFRKHSGFITVYGDLLIAEMTVQQAMEKALELDGCKGFTFEGADLGHPMTIYFKDKFDNVESSDWTSYCISAVQAADTVEASSSTTALPIPERRCSNDLVNKTDPFGALAAGLNDDISGIAPFADLAESSLLSVADVKRAERTSSMDSAGSTLPGSIRGRNGSVISLGSDESLETLRQAVPTVESKTLQERRLHRTVPVIPWGIEDELPVPHDPLATLWI